jgi:hypothetical protein
LIIIQSIGVIKGGGMTETLSAKIKITVDGMGTGLAAVYVIGKCGFTCLAYTKVCRLHAQYTRLLEG